MGFSTSNKRTTLHLNTAVTSISILLLLSILKEEFNLHDQFCFVFQGGLCSPYRFDIYNIEQKHGLCSMIFYDTKVISECDSRHSLSLYIFRYSNLIRHHTITSWIVMPQELFLCATITNFSHQTHFCSLSLFT